MGHYERKAIGHQIGKRNTDPRIQAQKYRPEGANGSEPGEGSYIM